MREMDFSESNFPSQTDPPLAERNGWFGVKSIRRQIQGEVRGHIKFRLERALVFFFSYFC
jgi:hypothetical protein